MEARIKDFIAEEFEPSGLSKTEYILFIKEQFILEKLVYDEVIATLISKLRANNIDESGILAIHDLNDHYFEKLLRYRLGISGKLFGARRLVLPYSLRRKLFKKNL